MKPLYLLAALLSPLFSFAEIAPIDSIGEVQHYLDQNTQALIAFDIDDTLTVLSEPAFQRPNFKTHHADAFIRLISPLNPQEKFIAFTLPLLASPANLIEPNAHLHIQDLQSKGHSTIALTAAPAGEIGGIPVEDRRIAELARVGIDFSSSFPHLSATLFAHFAAPVMGSQPFYKNGVLFTNEANKGDVLVAFLKSAHIEPTLVVFVDDRIEHLHAVEKALFAYSPAIRFQGLHFQGEHGAYQMTDLDTFTQKWGEMVEKSREILSPKQ